MGNHVQESALAHGNDLGNALDRVRQQGAVSDDAEPPGPFGDQDVAPREEGDGPGVLEAVGHRDQVEVVESGAVVGRLCGTWRSGYQGESERQERDGGANHAQHLCKGSKKTWRVGRPCETQGHGPARRDGVPGKRSFECMVQLRWRPPVTLEVAVGVYAGL